METIPEAYREAWDEADQELAVAAQELAQATERYQAAIIARIGLAKVIRLHNAS